MLPETPQQLICRHRLRIEGQVYCASLAMALGNRRLGSLELCQVCPQKDQPGPDVPLERIYEIARVNMGEPVRRPTLPVRISNYLGALIRWAHASYPERSQQQVQAILEVCRGCRHFKATADLSHACEHCGCGGLPSKWTGGLVEKITMRTESCPLKKW